MAHPAITMTPYLPPHDYQQLAETIALLVRANFKRNRHPFIHPDSLSGLTEDLAAKHDWDLNDARGFVVCLTAKQARVMLKDIL